MKLVTGCWHSHEQSGQLALIAVGNSLRQDDGVAAVLCQMLPCELTAQLCFFELGPYTGQIKDCLTGHKTGVLVDSMSGGGQPGTSVIVDLTSLIKSGGAMQFKLSHGLSLVDELYLAGQIASLPEQVTLFGVEAADSGWGEGLSPVLQNALPGLVEFLARHIELQLSLGKAQSCLSLQT